MLGRSAIVGISISLSIAALVVFNVILPKQGKIFLQSDDQCMPCSTGKEDVCHAGCLTELGIRMRLQSVKTLQSQLSALKKAKKSQPPMISLASVPTQTEIKRQGPESVESSKREILRENAELLRLDHTKQGGLGEVLNSVQRNLLRAEAAEVRLRRQAKLQGGTKKTIMEVFQHLRCRSIKKTD